MLVLGVNTGTSVDGVDFSLVDWDLSDLKNYRIVKEASYQFDPNVKHDIEVVIAKQKAQLEELSNLNFLYSQFVAALVLEFAKEFDQKIELIGMHGQTVFHGERSTLQLGNPSIVSELTGITTIGDFRTADMAAGGCGAPLTSYLDHMLIRSETESRATLNLGGIANITVMEEGKDTIAYDTGPANTLIDLLTRKLFQQDFDTDGELAYQGKVDESFVAKLIARTDYFSMSPPKSTGRELFDEKYADRFLDLGNKQNIISTVSYFTAKTISNELKKYNLSKVYISGGGMRNKFVMEQLAKLNPGVEFLSHKEFGINCQYKEAILFSLLAFTCYHKIPNNLPSSTGAKRATVLGTIAAR
ncbi:MAG: anhydro-N-acetylmuramic acid kinase [Candidatus Melainabacteria bacterium]|nr:anhydro-N-acetylmuramic acid kinase [Candidatus Melainabacteria bacterium]